MSRTFLRLRFLMSAALLVSGLLSSPATTSAQTAAEGSTAKRVKDYSPLRIRGRQMRELPGIGTIHADLIEQEPGGDVLLSGCVFLERPREFGYAPKARWNPTTGVLILEENWVLESAASVMEGTGPGGVMHIDQKGVFKSIGRHRLKMR